MTDRVVALGRSRIRKIIGAPPPDDLERVEGALLIVPGLAR